MIAVGRLILDAWTGSVRLGVSFDLMTGRPALGHETAASVLAAFSLGAST